MTKYWVFYSIRHPKRVTNGLSEHDEYWEADEEARNIRKEHEDSTAIVIRGEELHRYENPLVREDH